MYIIKTSFGTIFGETEKEANETFERINSKRDYIRELVNKGFHISKAHQIANGQTTIEESLTIK